MDFFDVESHVGLPLPAAQHQVIHLFGASTRSLQHPTLCDALDHLQEAAETQSRMTTEHRLHDGCITLPRNSLSTRCQVDTVSTFE